MDGRCEWWGEEGGNLSLLEDLGAARGCINTNAHGRDDDEYWWLLRFVALGYLFLAMSGR